MHADFEMPQLGTISIFGFFLSQLWCQVSVPMQSSDDFHHVGCTSASQPTLPEYLPASSVITGDN